ncbi:MAG: bifunctional D-glycero-beta-D-manno-heptose-7-phosphate kinase/D-glycero-beta-D-manno-heptose 1-phosphate adenylyltransferase HldE [Pseudomonadota bacterium]|nr:bifunctional D-glycero-beta-D-manno-heptose-7-phosphate kinase/D-glycero-beta-D-manno-heptose 1-phosphate adenylyltransferase HldE [Gammaproteobacteria bacterium]MDQ3581723.1 bifunctional D-glycero-beta-D-manno-heptose-7-phosphate kinase/D-glycero-beta-D-manno-heptose 1-phosphate adenylyltransferase HldE [Pseudomonadota bacterium]
MTLSPRAFQSASILVVGDVILDRYWSGATGRISPEAPVPVVHVTVSEERPGGAANVAANVAALGAGVMLIGVTGADEAAAVLADRLEALRVRCRFTRVAGSPTTVKLRVLSQHQQLIRLDFELHNEVGGWMEQLFEDFRSALPGAQVVVLSDYAKGSLANVERIIDLARSQGKPIVVDPKGRDFSRYRGAQVLTPNTKELEAVVGECAGRDELIDKGRRLCETLGLAALLVTRGERGMLLIPREGEETEFPAKAREVYDVTGAGDTVVAVLATALAAGQDLKHAAALANTAAGIVVGKLGAASVSVEELAAALHDEVGAAAGIVSENVLIGLVERARLRGETVVMTNGCFDILHAGHVRYLAEARALGDRLVVAVNDDASAGRLKGPGRPVNPLAQRLAVLAGLRSVDWVVPFTEDTPERLICRVRPEVLVKGGDYRPEQIAGHGCVTDGGGRVVTLPLVAGCSSTRVVTALEGLTEGGSRS